MLFYTSETVKVKLIKTFKKFRTFSRILQTWKNTFVDYSMKPFSGVDRFQLLSFLFLLCKGYMVLRIRSITTGLRPLSWHSLPASLSSISTKPPKLPFLAENAMVSLLSSTFSVTYPTKRKISVDCECHSLRLVHCCSRSIWDCRENFCLVTMAFFGTLLRQSIIGKLLILPKNYLVVYESYMGISRYEDR